MEYNVNEDAYNTKMKSAKPSVVHIVHDPFKVVADGDLRTLCKMLEDTEAPLNVNKSRWSGFSLLHRAAVQGCTDICQVLIENGARINERTIWGWHTPLHLALANGWDETAKYLIIAGADIHAKNKDKENMCAFAEKRGYKILAREFEAIALKLEGNRRLKERRERAAELSKKNAEQAALALIEEGNAAAAITAKKEQLLLEVPPEPESDTDSVLSSPKSKKKKAAAKGKSPEKGSKKEDPKSPKRGGDSPKRK